MSDDTVVRWLLKHAAQYPDSICAVGNGRRLTYADVNAAVGRVAGGLNRIGIRRGDVVTVQLPNAVEFLVSYLAVAAVGAIFQPAHLPYKGSDLRFLLAHSGARAFIGLGDGCIRSAVQNVLKMQAELPSLDFVISVGDDHRGAIPFRQLENSSCIDDFGALPQPGDTFLLLYTSGTTSNPKGVPHTSRTMLSGAASCADELQFGRDDLVYVLSYGSHMWGLSAFTMALYKGSSVLLGDRFSPAIFGTNVACHEPTIVICAPVHLVKAAAEGVLASTDTSSIRQVVTSGSGFPGETAVEIHEMLGGADMLELLGMTEVAPVCVSRPGSPFETTNGTVGPKLPHCDIRVVDNDGLSVGNGLPGELQVIGSSVFEGYLKNSEANAASFTADGWFITGDVASIDRDGVVRIGGRTKDVINRGGVKFAVTEIETCIARHTDIEQCAIVPVSDPEYGEKACCVVIEKGDSRLRLETICAYLADHGVEKMKWPEQLIVVNEMPLTPTGKIMKGRLSDIAARVRQDSQP